MALRNGQHRKLVTALGGILTVTACAFALVLPIPAAEGYSPRSALNDLNAMRVASGVPRVRATSSKLNKGCRLHNLYMRRTGSFGHYQSRASRYYTRLGARAAARSVIAQPGALPTRAFGGTIYHRLALLQPRLKRTGYSSNYGFTCLQVLSSVSNAASARTAEVTTYPWPASGMVGLDPRFSKNEWPDPLNDAPGATQLGTPITFAVNGPWQFWNLSESVVTSATLTSESGQSIAVSVSDANSPNGRYLQGGFALLPRRVLPAETWHTATASGYINYEGASYPFTTSTRFRTGSDDGF